MGTTTKTKQSKQKRFLTWLDDNKQSKQAHNNDKKQHIEGKTQQNKQTHQKQ